MSILRLAAVIAALVAGALPTAAQTPPEKIRISVAPSNYAFLPIFLAIDEGLFAAQNLDVEVTKFQGSANTQVPALVRGDLDMAVVVLGPPIFNQFAQGFDLKLIASLSEAHPGWNGATWIMVRQDLWDAGTIKTIADLRGKRLDDGVIGTVADVMVREALAEKKIATSDVTLTYNTRSPADWFAGLRNRAYDAMGMVEPIASEIQDQKLAHKWLTYNDTTPWIQDAYFAASAPFLKAHPDAARRFLIAVLKADREIDASGGKWTPMLVDEVAKWSQVPKEDILRVPGPNYVGQQGAIRPTSIDRVQKVLVQLGAVKQAVPVDQMIDTTALDAARRSVK